MKKVFEIWASGNEIASFTNKEEAVAEYNRIKANYKEITLFSYKVKAD